MKIYVFKKKTIFYNPLANKSDLQEVNPYELSLPAIISLSLFVKEASGVPVLLGRDPMAPGGGREKGADKCPEASSMDR